LGENVALSVVIPCLDGARTLGPVLAAVTAAPAGLVEEVILVDGGSRDGSPDLARARGAVVVLTPPSRGGQLAAGARRARGEWLLFLHTDTELEPGWGEEVARFIADPAHRHRAAAFTLAFDNASVAARLVAALANSRTRFLGLAYGDQGLLMSRALYNETGGFRDLPLMEDVDLVRRIGRRRLVLLPCRAVTSGERYRRLGFLLRALRNLAVLTLYYAGVPPRILARLYG
jgi:rSAM/selenodomain-associated transferase 2